MGKSAMLEGGNILHIVLTALLLGRKQCDVIFLSEFDTMIAA